MAAIYHPLQSPHSPLRCSSRRHEFEGQADNSWNVLTFPIYLPSFVWIWFIGRRAGDLNCQENSGLCSRWRLRSELPQLWPPAEISSTIPLAPFLWRAVMSSCCLKMAAEKAISRHYETNKWDELYSGRRLDSSKMSSFDEWFRTTAPNMGLRKERSRVKSEFFYFKMSLDGDVWL